MAKEKKEMLQGREVPQSVPILITDQVVEVFEALKLDIKSHPPVLTSDGQEIEGIDAVAYRLGVSDKTIRSWWNPGKDRTIKLDTLIELSFVCPITNTINALNTTMYIFNRKIQELAEQKTERKLREFKEQIGALK